MSRKLKLAIPQWTNQSIDEYDKENESQKVECDCGLFYYGAWSAFPCCEFCLWENKFTSVKNPSSSYILLDCDGNGNLLKRYDISVESEENEDDNISDYYIDVNDESFNDNSEDDEKPKLIQCDACITNKCKRINRGINHHDNGKNYCNLHNEKHIWLDDIAARNKKACTGHKRGCKAELDIGDEKTRCDECNNKLLQKSREYDKTVRKKERDIARETEGRCVSCRREDIDSSEFKDIKGNDTVQCKVCREKQAECDRERRANGTKKEYVISENAKKKKEEWKRNNPEKQTEYQLRHRGKMMKEQGDNYYVIQNAKMNDYRKEHPEYCERMNENKKMDEIAKLKSLKKQADIKNNKWFIDDEYALALFWYCCYYCNTEPHYPNGIDRVDNDKEYTDDNIVSCCKVCNYMKSCLDINTFINRCEHILTTLGIIEGRTFGNIFGDHKSNYNTHVARAKNICNGDILSKITYDQITSEKCYLCKKQNTHTHTNGIDRFDPTIGYIVSNCKPCCAECNYMKGRLQYDEFINHIIKIYKTHALGVSNKNNDCNDIIVTNKTLFIEQDISCCILKHTEITDIANGRWIISVINTGMELLHENVIDVDLGDTLSEITLMEYKKHYFSHLLITQSVEIKPIVNTEDDCTRVVNRSDIVWVPNKLTSSILIMKTRINGLIYKITILECAKQLHDKHSNRCWCYSPFVDFNKIIKYKNERAIITNTDRAEHTNNHIELKEYTHYTCVNSIEPSTKMKNLIDEETSVNNRIMRRKQTVIDNTNNITIINKAKYLVNKRNNRKMRLDSNI